MTATILDIRRAKYRDLINAYRKGAEYARRIADEYDEMAIQFPSHARRYHIEAARHRDRADWYLERAESWSKPL